MQLDLVMTSNHKPAKYLLFAGFFYASMESSSGDVVVTPCYATIYFIGKDSLLRINWFFSQAIH